MPPRKQPSPRDPSLSPAPPRRQRQKKPLVIPETYQLLVDCADEAAQRALFERLTSEGRRCRVLTL
jgi:hypothetical protein